MPIGVSKVVILFFRGVARFIVSLSPRSLTPHEVKDVARAHL